MRRWAVSAIWETMLRAMGAMGFGTVAGMVRIQAVMSCSLRPVPWQPGQVSFHLRQLRERYVGAYLEFGGHLRHGGMAEHRPGGDRAVVDAARGVGDERAVVDLADGAGAAAARAGALAVERVRLRARRPEHHPVLGAGQRQVEGDVHGRLKSVTLGHCWWPSREKIRRRLLSSSVEVPKVLRTPGMPGRRRSARAAWTCSTLSTPPARPGSPGAGCRWTVPPGSGATPRSTARRGRARTCPSRIHRRSRRACPGAP